MTEPTKNQAVLKGSIVYNEALIEEFKGYQKKAGISQAKAAQGIGVSATTISQYLSKTYPSDPVEIERKIRTWLTAQQRKAQKPQVEFVETDTVRGIWWGIDQAQDGEDITLITGAAGTGKTLAAMRYAERNSNAVLVEVGSVRDITSVVRTLAKALDVSTAGNTGTIVELIIDKVRDRGMVLVFDEADRLNYRALDTVRRIGDMARCGIVLIGLPELAAELKYKKRDFDQIASRVGTVVAVPPISQADAKTVLQSTGRKWDDKALGALCKAADGSLRKFVKLVQNCCKVLLENSLDLIDAEVVEVAGRVSMK
jgi:DNA transposition AAA+ family ATPase